MRGRRHLAIGTFLSLACAQAAAAQTIRIAEDGQPQAVVVIAAEASEQVRDAAQILVRYLQLSSGAGSLASGLEEIPNIPVHGRRKSQSPKHKKP